LYWELMARARSHAIWAGPHQMKEFALFVSLYLDILGAIFRKFEFIL
jgi:hypothetical protein